MGQILCLRDVFHYDGYAEYGVDGGSCSEHLWGEHFDEHA